MKQIRAWIKRWGIVCVIGVALGVMLGGTALAGRTGSVTVIEDSGRSLVFNTMTAISNSEPLFNRNGIVEKIFVIFTNTGNGTIDFNLQHSNDGVAFANAQASAVVFSAADTDSYIQTFDVNLLPYIRFNTVDVNITVANGLTIELQGWK